MQLALRRRLVRALLVPVALLLVPVLTGAALVESGPAPSAGRTFHVACTAKTRSGDGSPAHPWPALSMIGEHGSFAPGDRILLRRGTTCHGRIAPTGSGTVVAPIVLGAYGRGRLPIIDGGGTPDSTGVVQLDNVGGWTVRDLHLTNATRNRYPKQKRAGVLVRNTIAARITGIRIEHLLVEQVESSISGHDNTRQFGGIAVQTLGLAGGYDGVVITENTVRRSGRSGIAVFNTTTRGDRDRRLRVTGNQVERARGDSIVVYGQNDARLDHNVSADGSNMTPCTVAMCGRMGGPSTASAGIWPAMSTRVRIDHNEVYGEHAAAGDGEGIDVDLYAKDVVVEHNYLHDNEGGGVMFCGARDTVVRFNVIQYNRKAAFVFTCGWQKDQRVKNITITNNDVVTGGQRHPAYWVVRNIHPHPGTAIRFTNNVVSCSGTCVYTWPKRPYAAANTFVGARSRSEPSGPGTIHASRPLRAPGSGGRGFRSLGGYHRTIEGRAARGVRISGTGLRDVFGRPVSASRPPRGAAVR